MFGPPALQPQPCSRINQTDVTIGHFSWERFRDLLSVELKCLTRVDRLAEIGLPGDETTPAHPHRPPHHPPRRLVIF